MPSDNKDECCSTHLIDGDGTFNVAGVENFMKEVKLAECGLSYAVVSIMGPQSSGMNSLFKKPQISTTLEYNDFKLIRWSLTNSRSFDIFMSSSVNLHGFD